MNEAEKALACAMRALARRDHSVAELERKLRGKEVSAAVTAEVIAGLKNAGYLDDRRFAERWADAAVRNGRGFGPRIQLELIRRGVNREMAAEVVAVIAGAYGEEETLAALVAKKFARFDPQTATGREKNRVIAYLNRRGFPIAAILRVFRGLADDRNICE